MERSRAGRHRGHPCQLGGGIRPAIGFPWGQTMLLVPLVKPEATQPAPGLGICSLDLAFAATGHSIAGANVAAPVICPAAWHWQRPGPR